MTTSLPTTATRNEMAAMFSISPQRVSQLAALGVFRKSPDGGYFIEGAVPAYAEFRANAAVKRQNQSGMDGLRLQQLRRLEMQLRREDAELITREEAVETAHAMIDAMVASVLTIPSRLEAGSALRASCESAIPRYAKELERDLLKCIEPLEAARNNRGG